MAMPSCKNILLLFVRFNVCYGLYPSYQSEAANVPPANTSGSQGKGGISSGTIAAIVVSISVAVLIFLVGICCLSKRKRKRHDSVPEEKSASYISMSVPPQYDFITIKKATNKFSSANLVHRGPYADVYWGTLPNGQEIAAKTFKTRAFLQNVEVFNNELEVYAKVQHRNLAIPVGFSVQGDEKILVYEYFSNQSLDRILSDPEKRRELNWVQRYKIVKEIAQGIQYLHEDSRLRIIHRNIKCFNILLDNDMNPRITDFGMALMFPIDETERDAPIAGTKGYVAPESYKNARVSSKCDVYSFGVLLTEIISGRTSWEIMPDEYIKYHSHSSLILPSMKRKHIVMQAWDLWMDGQALELLDPTIRESYNPNEVMRCIHIAMLCVQKDPAKRPSMASVVLMLENYSMTLPSPSP